MKYYVFDNTNGLIIGGGGITQAKASSMASGTVTYEVYASPVILNGEVTRIENGATRAWTQAEIDAKAAADAQAAQGKAARIQDLTDKLTGLTPNQLDTYIENNVTNIASAKTYLKRLTLIVQALAIESGK